MEDEQILELFWQRSELAIRELERKYGRLCRRVARGVLADAQDGGDNCTLWRIEDGVLTAWWEMQEPYRYVTDLILSPDREKIAICLASNKSGFLIVADFAGGSIGGELVNTALMQYRAEHAQPISVRADFETYSWPENIAWQDEDTLCFDAGLYLASEGDTAAVQAVYHVSSGSLEMK